MEFTDFTLDASYFEAWSNALNKVFDKDIAMPVYLIIQDLSKGREALLTELSSTDEKTVQMFKEALEWALGFSNPEHANNTSVQALKQNTNITIRSPCYTLQGPKRLRHFDPTFESKPTKVMRPM